MRSSHENYGYVAVKLCGYVLTLKTKYIKNNGKFWKTIDFYTNSISAYFFGIYRQKAHAC